MTKDQPKPSYLELALTFLRIGFVSFGGFIALMSIVERTVSEKKGWLDSDDVIEGITLTNLLPGAMAVNLVAFVGYKIKGVLAAMLCVVAVLTPSLSFTLALTYFYLLNNQGVERSPFFDGVTLVIGLIVLQVVIKMLKRVNLNVLNGLLILLATVGFALGRYFEVPLLAPLVLLVYGIYGFATSNQVNSDNKLKQSNNVGFRKKIGLPLLVVGILVVFIQFLPLDSGLFSIVSNFSSLSLTIFGGGYVFIPIAQNFFVDQLNWVTDREFIDAIAIGQVTPGPIMVSVSFIGYKLGGLTGGLLATLSFFVFPCVLIVQASKMAGFLSNSVKYKAVLSGVKLGVIGMIVYSLFIILFPIYTSHEGEVWRLFFYSLLLVGSWVILEKTKIPFVVLILSNGFITLIADWIIFRA